MLTVLYAVIPVVSWGVWLTPSQNVSVPNQQVKTFYVAVANLGLATFVFAAQGPAAWQELSLGTGALVFAGGVIWSLGGLCAFTATDKVGSARAFGIWAPLNIVVSMLWGALLFREFVRSRPYTLPLLLLAVLVIIAGVLLIIFAKGTGAVSDQNRGGFLLGLSGAIGAGVLWGSYFVPIHYAGISMWVGGLALALGMLFGSLLLAWQSHTSFRLENAQAYLRVLATGLIWGIGNYGMLQLVGALGAGRGFTIAQLSVVVNALMGVFVLKEPTPHTRAATMTLVGCILATIGGIVLGILK
ncbi:MAG TPA: GRP family sugar transporter [Pyrinomonadaceae bacterium]|nr:GRP family sugar transporter [Pyrinomonadaceae bacterium]